jgi:hypothetical protein
MNQIAPLALFVSLAALALETPAQSARECIAPLACKASKSCPTFSEASREAEQTVREQPNIKAGIGKCGDLKYVYRNTGRGSQTLFFDAQDRLVAESTSTDALAAPCFGSKHYGVRVECEAVVTREFAR